MQKLDSLTETQKVKLIINQEEYNIEVPPTETLLSTLRNRLHLTGTKYGCGEGECGACNVIFDGKLVNSCLVLTMQADQKEIITIEGYKNDQLIQKIQDAFIEKGAVQCGYCTPGMIMSARALLEENKAPSVDEIREGISGNLCRCTGYIKIVEAINSVEQ